MVTGGLGSGGITAGAAGTTIGAGAMTGSGGAALGGVCLTTCFLVFGTTCLGAGSVTTAGCSATATGAGADSTATSGADGCSAATTAGAGAGASFGLVAQADNAKAEKRRATGIAILSFLDIAFSRNTVGDMRSGGNLPTVSNAPQTIKS